MRASLINETTGEEIWQGEVGSVAFNAGQKIVSEDGGYYVIVDVQHQFKTFTRPFFTSPYVMCMVILREMNKKE